MATSTSRPAFRRSSTLGGTAARVVRELSRSGELSRAELSRRLGVSPAAVGEAVRKLEHNHLLEEGPTAPAEGARGGRPQRLLRLSRGAGYVIAADIGHRTIVVQIADTRGRPVGDRVYIDDYDVDAMGPAALKLVAEQVRSMLDRTESKLDPREVRAIALGLPAPIDRDTDMVYAGIPESFQGVALTKTLRTYLGSGFEDTVILFENDANLLAVGELAAGGEHGSKDFAVVKLSAGIGLGLVLAGKIYRGGRGAAGELGHTRVPELAVLENWPERNLECPRCGRSDCLELYASGPGILRRLGSGGRTVAEMETELIRAVRDHAPENLRAQRAIQDAGKLVGAACADLVTLLDMDKVVIAGVMSLAGPTLLEPIEAAIRDKALRPVEVTAIDRTRRPSAAIAGAIALGLRETEPMFMRAAVPS